MHIYIRKGLLILMSLAFSLLACSAVTTTAVKVQPEAPLNSGVSVASSGLGNNRVEAVVSHVIDGDTIEVNISGAVFKLRYIGIDAPELDSMDTNTRNIALKAAGKNRELTAGKTVELEKDVSETDKYGRILRYVYSGGLMVNGELVKLGYAQASPYPPDIKYKDLFNSLQAGAKAAKIGLWAQSGYYSTPKPTEKGIYVGSKISDKYHYPSCFWAQKIAAENEIWFSSTEEAKSGGYIPCKVCKPPQ
jgi:micrococcal nuclease